MRFTVEGLRNIRLLPRDPSEPPDPSFLAVLDVLDTERIRQSMRLTWPVALVGDGAASPHALPFAIVTGKSISRIEVSNSGIATLPMTEK